MKIKTFLKQRSKKTVSSLMEPYEKQLKEFKQSVDGFNRQNQDLRGIKDSNRWS